MDWKVVKSYFDSCISISLSHLFNIDVLHTSIHGIEKERFEIDPSLSTQRKLVIHIPMWYVHTIFLSYQGIYQGWWLIRTGWDQTSIWVIINPFGVSKSIWDIHLLCKKEVVVIKILKISFGRYWLFQKRNTFLYSSFENRIFQESNS